MQLIGYMDSPFVRRTAISMQFLGIDYEHRELSIFRDFEEFRSINPMVKVPTLLLDSGEVLVDSTLIIAYLESQLARRSLMPDDGADYLAAVQQIGVALLCMEKVASIIYETTQRPVDLQHQPWIDRLEIQLKGAVELMESYVSDCPDGTWLSGSALSQADISTAVAWRFIQHIDRVKRDPVDYPALAAFSARAEALPEFVACPLSD